MKEKEKKTKGWVHKYDVTSLRIIGSVGENIDAKTWKWLYEVVGKRNVSIVDTYWQTETGGIILSPLPGATRMKPGSATFPLFGIDVAVLDPSTGKELVGNGIEGVLAIKQPWPGLARSILGDHQRYKQSYLSTYPGYYFTTDGCRRDQDGYIWITGRTDDVVNVSGHRIGSAEVEAAISTTPAVAESAVVGIPHEVKGSSLFAFVVLKETAIETRAEIIQQLKKCVREQVGAFAVPDHVLLTTAGLLKTRSGKVMRRLLRKIAIGQSDAESLGDVSTLSDPLFVPKLVAEVRGMK